VGRSRKLMAFTATRRVGDAGGDRRALQVFVSYGVRPGAGLQVGVRRGRWLGA
jgi:hypothetical protein